MAKCTKLTAVGLILMLLLTVMVPAVFAADVISAEDAGVYSIEKADEYATEMADNFWAYHEEFSEDEQIEIKASYDALMALSDSAWETMIIEKGLLTAPFIAKYPSEADAKVALRKLIKDTFRVLYAVYDQGETDLDEGVLKEACKNFIVQEWHTIGLIFGKQATPPMLVKWVEETENILKDSDISGSMNDMLSDYWNIVWGTDEDYIVAADNVFAENIMKAAAVIATPDVTKGPHLSDALASLNWDADLFTDLHEEIIKKVDADYRANSVMYDSILRKHSELYDLTNNHVVDGDHYTLKVGQSVTMRFRIFGKIVSVPFGSRILLPANSQIGVSTSSTGEGTFTVTGKKPINEYEMQVRRGSDAEEDPLVRHADLFKNFYVTVKTSNGGGGGGGGSTVTPTPTPSTEPTSGPEILEPTAAVIGQPEDTKDDEITVDLEEKTRGLEYQLHMTINGEEVPLGTVKDYFTIEVKMPTDWKATDNIVLYYNDADGNKVLVDHKITPNGVISANTNYIGEYYLKKVSTDVFTGDHILYLVGDDLGHFNPDNNMTRGEAARMFYNLLKEHPIVEFCPFSDVPENMFYTNAIHVLAGYNIISGYEDGTFRPEDSITRAEFASMVVRFIDVETEGSVPFTDVKSGDWFYNCVLTAYLQGWIAGYEDNTFRPNNYITRAEVTTIMNHILDRSADKAYVDANAGGTVLIFPDAADNNYWAYYQIVEATNAHNYDDKVDDGETWTEVVSGSVPMDWDPTKPSK